MAPERRAGARPTQLSHAAANVLAHNPRHRSGAASWVSSSISASSAKFIARDPSAHNGIAANDPRDTIAKAAYDVSLTLLNMEFLHEVVSAMDALAGGALLITRTLTPPSPISHMPTS